MLENNLMPEYKLEADRKNSLLAILATLVLLLTTVVASNSKIY